MDHPEIHWTKYETLALNVLFFPIEVFDFIIKEFLRKLEGS